MESGSEWVYIGKVDPVGDRWGYAVQSGAVFTMQRETRKALNEVNTWTSYMLLKLWRNRLTE